MRGDTVAVADTSTAHGLQVKVTPMESLLRFPLNPILGIRRMKQAEVKQLWPSTPGRAGAGTQMSGCCVHHPTSTVSPKMKSHTGPGPGPGFGVGEFAQHQHHGVEEKEREGRGRRTGRGKEEAEEGTGVGQEEGEKKEITRVALCRAPNTATGSCHSTGSQRPFRRTPPRHA